MSAASYPLYKPWNDYLRDAKLQLDFARAYRKELEGELAPGTTSEPLLERSRRAELQALKQYGNTLRGYAAAEGARAMAADPLQELLRIAVQFTGADLGNVQVREQRENGLKIRAQIGFHRPFLEFFELVATDDSACGVALKNRQRVVIGDITLSPVFMGLPSLQAMLDAGSRAVQSTPLVNDSGELVGMISTHYRTPTRPSEHDLRFIDELAGYASLFLA